MIMGTVPNRIFPNKKSDYLIVLRKRCSHAQEEGKPFREGVVLHDGQSGDEVAVSSRYFVALCTTMSAPSSRGLWRYGDMNVLSTMASIPCLLETSAMAAMSVAVISGLAGLSMRTALTSSTMSFSKDSGDVVSDMVYLSRSWRTPCQGP